MALIKREIITNREVLHASSVLVLRKKEAFQNSDFSRLKCKKKIDTTWQIILTSPPCLHSLMQTHLSANHSARAISVIRDIKIHVYRKRQASDSS